MARGDLRTLLAEGDVHAFARVLVEQVVVVVQHRGEQPTRVRLPLWATGVRTPLVDATSTERFPGADVLDVTMAPRSGRTLVSDPSWLPTERAIAAVKAPTRDAESEPTAEPVPPPGTVD